MNASIESDDLPDLPAQGGIATFLFTPRRPVSEMLVLLDVLAPTRIENKELLCELRLYAADGTPIATHESNWPFSSSLKAVYQYLPQVEGQALLQLKTFKAGTAFAKAVLSIRPWGRRVEEGELQVRSGFATERCMLGGRSYLQYHALERLGSAND